MPSAKPDLLPANVVTAKGVLLPTSSKKGRVAVPSVPVAVIVIVVAPVCPVVVAMFIVRLAPVPLKVILGVILPLLLLADNVALVSPPRVMAILLMVCPSQTAWLAMTESVGAVASGMPST